MRKKGRTIKNYAAIMPFGIKRTTYEFSARAAMLAIERGQCNEQHIVDMWVLADLSEHLNANAERHIATHAASVKKLAETIYNKTCDGLAASSIIASGCVLLNWIHTQDNKRVFDVAMMQSKRLVNQQNSAQKAVNP